MGKNHICVISDESYLNGMYRTGIGEVVDSLAVAFRNAGYPTTLILPGGAEGKVRGKAGKTVRVGVVGDSFWEKAASIANDLDPEAVLAFNDPSVIDHLSAGKKKVFAFDSVEDVQGKEKYFCKWDSIVTMSPNYAQEVIASGGPVSDALKCCDFRGVLLGLWDGLYGGDHSAISDIMMRRYGIPEGKAIFLIQCRLTEAKGIDWVLDDIDEILDAGGWVVVFGVGDKTLEERLMECDKAGKLTYFHRMADWIGIQTWMKCADFFLSPSRREVGGLMPMKAATYGCVPIIRPVGGLSNNFDETNSIVVNGEDVGEAVRRAMEIWKNGSAMDDLRKAARECDFGWKNRMRPFIEMLGLPMPEKLPPKEVGFFPIISAPAKAEPPFAIKKGGEPDAQ